MKKSILFLFFTTSLYVIAGNDQKDEKCQLPITNGLIIYKESKTIPVTRMELCEYFFTNSFYNDMNNKLNAAAINMQKQTLSGITNYTYGLAFNESSLGGKSIYKCNPQGNDTIKGKLVFNSKFVSRMVTNGYSKTKDTKITFMINIIFLNRQEIYISLKGVNLQTEEFVPGWEHTTAKDEYLQDAYEKFLKEKNSSKEDKEMYTKVNEMAALFYDTFFKALDMQVKLLETD